MTQFELWTMDSKRLLTGFENACFAAAHGKKTAGKAMDILGGEILRRMRILEQMDEERDFD